VRTITLAKLLQMPLKILKIKFLNQYTARNSRKNKKLIIKQSKMRHNGIKTKYDFMNLLLKMYDGD
jgi:hypothetical protein